MLIALASKIALKIKISGCVGIREITVGCHRLSLFLQKIMLSTVSLHNEPYNSTNFQFWALKKQGICCFLASLGSFRWSYKADASVKVGYPK